MWQAEDVTELTLSASPAMEVGQFLLTMAKSCYNTVPGSVFAVATFEMKLFQQVNIFLFQWPGPTRLGARPTATLANL